MIQSKWFKPAITGFAGLLVILALVTFAAPVSAQNGNGDLTGERLVNARREPQNWATYFGVTVRSIRSEQTT